jgi:hypothetical protein
MLNVPVTVAFKDKNVDGFALDQHDDAILHISASIDREKLGIEIWGNTTLITPTEVRHKDRRFQQTITVRFEDENRFQWHAERIVWDDVPWADDVSEMDTAPSDKETGKPVSVVQLTESGVPDNGLQFTQSARFTVQGSESDVRKHSWSQALRISE